MTRIGRTVAVGVLILAALLAPVALPVRMYVEWVRRKKVTIEQVVTAGEKVTPLAR